ncbi:NUDIX domain-containing protein [Pararhizobium haloflavum]|uniref:NUDIX domain-containing protein n=1 Tax=Pararhizobium haloflavum TaxID=2037914 RepID=UPI000C195277|nr:NUDIX domain-containing protein [Pararhizobium haloflavum]
MCQQPRKAVSAIVVDQERVLLVKRANHPARDLYAFPGGRVDVDEAPAAAALRELAEETGLIGGAARPYRDYDLIDRDESGRVLSHFLLTVFRVSLDPASPVQPVAADDAAEAGWFTRDEALALPMPDSVAECIREILAQTGTTS